MCLYGGKNLCRDILQAWREVNEGDLHLAAKSWGVGEEVAGGWWRVAGGWWLVGLFSPLSARLLARIAL